MDETKQLGDFIKGRLQFLENYCKEHHLDAREKKEQFYKTAMELAKTEEKKDYLEKKVFSGVILSTTLLPDWVDKILLEALTKVLGGPKARTFTQSSKEPCIPFEAGRFNAHRQAGTVFKIIFQGKKPEEFLEKSFKVLYHKCYGEEASRHLEIKGLGPRHYAITMPNRLLEKGNPSDCSTIIGYIYGSLEVLGAKAISVTHPQCSTEPNSPHAKCLFDVRWGI